MSLPGVQDNQRKAERKEPGQVSDTGLRGRRQADWRIRPKPCHPSVFWMVCTVRWKNTVASFEKQICAPQTLAQLVTPQGKHCSRFNDSAP
jgi:hypothetical protein